MSGDFQGILARAEELHSAGDVAAALDRMAEAVRRDLEGRDPLVLAVMLGGMLPATWLLQRLEFAHQLDYVHATRYRGGTRGGPALDWRARPRADLTDRHVLVVDDILDEGPTLAAILEACHADGAASVRSAVLVRKRHDRCVPGLAPDYVGLEVDDRYVFGCGMDYRERFRQLPAIYALAPEDEA
ncbi:MAG: hypoxanthine-guanine phosphoribosyltransferase [Gammaproteobacteria bacterium]